MNLYKIINDIKSTCMSHRDVQDFHYGDIYDYENTKSLKYINTNFTLQSISSGLDSDTKTINGVLFCVDRLTDNGDNKLIVQSRCTDILESIINRLTENYSGWSLENTVYEVFSTKFADLCAGCFCTFSLSVDEDSVCSDDEFVIKSKEIKGNGIYDVIGYDRIIVDVQPKLKEIEIVKNGVYLPEEDSDGYNKITVDVPPTPIQEKSVNITENGVKRIEPDSGYNLSGVDVNVNVPPTPVQVKSVNITENGTMSIEPDEGYNLSGVDVNVNVPPTPTQEKSVNITENGVKRIVPDSGYNLSGVDVNVNVLPQPAILPNRTKFERSNQTECPSFDYRNVISASNMFYSNKNLVKIGEMVNTGNITITKSMFISCNSLTSVPLFDASNVNDITDMFRNCRKLTDLGGFTNLGKAFSSAQILDISFSPLLTNQSVQNFIDTVFDMNQNTQGGSATLSLTQTVIDAMSDTQKSQLAAKGWTLRN